MELISRPPRIRHAKAPRHSQQHFAFPRRCQARAKLYVGAHKAVRGERSGRANGVDSLVARKPPRDDLIIGWRTSMVGREVDRDGRPTSVGRDYTPEGNRREGISTITVNDPYTRARARIRTMLPESFRDYLRRSARFRSETSCQATRSTKSRENSGSLPARARDLVTVPISSERCGAWLFSAL